MEGGVRIPMIWTWPGTLPEGFVYDEPVSALDILPTFLAAAEAEPLPLSDPPGHEDKRNRRRAVEKFGAYDGIDLIPVLTGEASAPERTLFWRLQGQAAILSGDDKLIRLSHRPAQMFQPRSDPGELTDLAPVSGTRFEELFRELADWEATLPTVPLWGSSPFWNSESAKHYDGLPPQDEPE